MSMVVTVSAALRVDVSVVAADAEQALAQVAAKLGSGHVVPQSQQRSVRQRLARHWLRHDMLPVTAVVALEVRSSDYSGGE